MEALYTSSEARSKLNASTSTFKRWVDNGKIRKVTPPNKKQGMYVKEDVDKLAEEMQPFTQNIQNGKRPGRKSKILKTEVDWQKISDLPAILKLDLEVYHESIVGDIGLYISWERKNPNITLLSYEASNRGNVLAYLSLIPLPEKIILSILKGEREETSINADEIETYERKGAYTLLAESAVTHPDHPEQLNHILREALRYWCDQYPDRYIEKIYAQAATDAGDVLIRRLYFSPLYDFSDNAYVLDLRKPGIAKPIKIFQECIQHKKREQGNKLAFLKNKDAATFAVAKPEDAQGIYEVIASLWGTLHTTPVQTRLSWYQKNPEIDHIVKQEDEVTGYVTIMPMKHEAIEKLIAGKIRGWDIKPDDILPFMPGVPLECYTGIAVKAGVNKPKEYGMRLLSGILNTMRSYAKKGIVITKLYAVSDTPNGVKLSRDLGFEEEQPAPGSTFNQYVLDLEKSESPFAVEYRELLTKSKAKNLLGENTKQSGSKKRQNKDSRLVRENRSEKTTV